MPEQRCQSGKANASPSGSHRLPPMDPLRRLIFLCQETLGDCAPRRVSALLTLTEDDMPFRYVDHDRLRIC